MGNSDQALRGEGTPPHALRLLSLTPQYHLLPGVSPSFPRTGVPVSALWCTGLMKTRRKRGRYTPPKRNPTHRAAPAATLAALTLPLSLAAVPPRPHAEPADAGAPIGSLFAGPRGPAWLTGASVGPTGGGQLW